MLEKEKNRGVGRRVHAWHTWVLVVMSILPSLAFANGFNVSVIGQDGLAVEDAVVELSSLAPLSPGRASVTGAEQMRQKNRTFQPFVLAVTKGTAVSFPNLDRTRHHVYSFSPAKSFELKLYVGTPLDPVLFDVAGIVALGCNIHDYMQGFIYVADSPLVAVTDASGRVGFDDLPDGDYHLRVWHPWQNGGILEVPATLSQTGASKQISINIERREKPKPPPSGFGGLGDGG